MGLNPNSNSNLKIYVIFPVLLVLVLLVTYMLFTDADMLFTDADKTSITNVEGNIQQEVNNVESNNAKLDIKSTEESSPSTIERGIGDTNKIDDKLLDTASVDSDQNNKADSDIKENNYQINYDILIVILSLTTLVSVLISFWLYRWRKVVIAGKEIVIPETFAKQVGDIVKAVSGSSSELGTVVNQQSVAVNKFNSSLSALDESIRNMIDTYMSLHSSLDQKDEEISRYKKGYDAKIFHNFLLRFARVDQVIKEYIGDGEIDLEGLKDIHEVMEDALEECDVESFSPEIGSDYRKSDGVADNPKKNLTSNKNENFLIKEILQPGYRRRLPDSKFEVIVQAKVVVYVYEEPGEEKEDSSA